jgi:hypothetical protein
VGKEGLTTKQRLFIESYLANGFNATEAARTAEYKGSDNVLAVTGFENLRNPKISAVVAERINEAANEVMARLSAIARGDLQDVTDEDGRFDFEKARHAKKTGLLKKLKRKTSTKKVDVSTDDEEAETLETSIVHEEVEFEMYSAHEALRDLGKFHKLFTDRTEITGKDGADLKFTINLKDGNAG